MDRIEHREEKWIFPFVEYSNCKKNEKLPLVIQLHGAGERGCGKEDLEKVDVHGFSKYLMDADHNCIVVMPQCPVDTFWAARVESIVKFVVQLIKEYNVDEDRVYLTGLSMGGYGTWYLLMTKPELFAAGVPVCGGADSTMAENIKNIPIWTFHGDVDSAVPVSGTRTMVKVLKDIGADIRYTEYPDVDHNSWVNAFNEPELLDWLFSKSK